MIQFALLVGPLGAVEAILARRCPRSSARKSYAPRSRIAIPAGREGLYVPDMGSRSTPTADTPPTRLADPRRVCLPLILVLVCAMAYGWFIVLPYYVNNLDEVPFEELAGGLHDPKDLWPRTTGAGEFVWGLGSLVTLAFGWFVTLGAGAWAAVMMWRERHVLRARGWVALGASVIGAAALFAGIHSAFGEALLRWWMD